MQITSFLVESKTFSVDQFPITKQRLVRFNRGGEDSVTKQIQRVVDNLNHYATGDVPNQRFNDVKAAVGRLVDEFGPLDLGMTEEWMEAMRANPKAFGFMWDLSPISQVGHLPGKLKKAEAFQKAHDDANAQTYLTAYIAAVKELIPVAEALDDMKKRVVKKAAKEPVTAETEYSKWVAPILKTEAGKKIVETLTDLSEKFKVGYAEALHASFMERAKEFASKDVPNQRKAYYHFKDLLGVGRAWTHKAMNDPYTLKPEADAVFKEIAELQASSMQQQFVIKNAQKLNAIVGTKASELKSATTGTSGWNAQVRSGVLQGDITFEFEDGSRFRVRNQVVWKARYNDRKGGYTQYVQFPTTFHDVRMPDGTALSQPSEQRMVEFFSKA